jgi:hypothetical protein
MGRREKRLPTQRRRDQREKMRTVVSAGRGRDMRSVGAVHVKMGVLSTWMLVCMEVDSAQLVEEEQKKTGGGTGIVLRPRYVAGRIEEEVGTDGGWGGYPSHRASTSASTVYILLKKAKSKPPSPPPAPRPST